MESDKDKDDFDFNEINLAEVRVAELQGSPPYVCASFKPVKGKEKDKKIENFVNITKLLDI